jgi:hypothetical protein
LQSARTSVEQTATAAKEIMGAGFGALDQAYKLELSAAQEQVANIAGAATIGCMSLLPLLRIEIFNNFFQILGLFFATAYTTIKDSIPAFGFLNDTFGRISNIVQIDLGGFFRSDVAVTIGMVIILVGAFICFLFYIWLICYSGISELKQDEVRGGKESKEYADIAKENEDTVWLAGWVITAVLFLYLPVTQTCFEVIVCSRSSYMAKFINTDCSNHAILIII